MHKKLEAELVSLAHQILQLKDKNDVVKLKNKAKEVYEKLAVLDFVNNYFLTTPQAKENKNDVLEQIDDAYKNRNQKIKPSQNIEKIESSSTLKETKNINDLEAETNKINAQNQAILQAEADRIAKRLLEREKKEAAKLEKIRQEALETARQAAEIKTEKETKKNISNTEDFKDSIPADVAANLFEKANTQKTSSATNTEKVIKKETVATANKSESQKNSVNDLVFKDKIQIGLNDRIAFVKHLFNFSQEEFNRVLSQLNSFTNEKDAKDFIINTVQTDYDWSNKEEYVERLFMLIERRFA
ncbi:MAG TPA: hypothetical protein ENK67_02865 [Flavobacteriia bacterium]|nr:hypothetical protein [Flavobacteriia bacterium]